MIAAAAKLDGRQIESILDKLVPAIAAPADHEYFRGVLTIHAEELSASEFGALVSRILKRAAA